MSETKGSCHVLCACATSLKGGNAILGDLIALAWNVLEVTPPASTVIDHPDKDPEGKALLSSVNVEKKDPVLPKKGYTVVHCLSPGCAESDPGYLLCEDPFTDECPVVPYENLDDFLPVVSHP